MASSGNFATWSPSTTRGFIDFASGNTSATMNTNYVAVDGTLAARTGKYYFEMNYAADGNFSDGRLYTGIHAIGTTAVGYGAPYHAADGSNHYNPDPALGLFTVSHRNASGRGNSNIGGSGTAHGTSYINTGLKVASANTIIMCAMDLDNYIIYWGINGNWKGLANSSDTSSSTDITAVTGVSIPSAFRGFHFSPAAYFSGATSGTTVIINAGQDSTFSGTITSGSANASDSNSVGDFYYTPPTNFLALSSSNLPISDDIDPAQTDDNIPTKLFNPILYTGNGGTNAVTGLGFQPDFVWLKRRDSSASHQLYDSNRGTGKLLSVNNADAEQTVSTGLNSFDSDGFTLGSAGGANVSSGTFVAWCWRANGGTNSTNNDGSTTSTVQANQAGGFSIITYDGNGSNRTIGHGLSTAPDFMVIKDRDGTNNYVTYSREVGADKRANLNNDIAWSSSSTSFQSTHPSSTVITLGTSNGVNQSSRKFVCYAWHNVEGYQKFGTYNGNSNTDGPFIYTGFRPALIFVKKTTGAAFWNVFYSPPKEFNSSANAYIVWNESDSEASGVPFDFFSNGFKIRSNGNGVNHNGNTFVFGAWADVPFKYNNAF